MVGYNGHGFAASSAALKGCDVIVTSPPFVGPWLCLVCRALNSLARSSPVLRPRNKVLVQVDRPLKPWCLLVLALAAGQIVRAPFRSLPSGAMLTACAMCSKCIVAHATYHGKAHIPQGKQSRARYPQGMETPFSSMLPSRLSGQWTFCHVPGSLSQSSHSGPAHVHLGSSLI